MTIVFNATTGISTPPVSVLGDTSGSITFVAPAVAGTNTQTLVAATGTLAPIVSGTAVASTSGTSIDFTSIPSWVKRITVMFAGVSTSGTSAPQIQLGDAGGIEATGYANIAGSTFTTNNTTRANSNTTGFYLATNQVAASTLSGSVILTLLNTNVWTCSGNISDVGNLQANYTSGAKTLSDTLTQVRITANGTDTFDAGTINILYE
jgi:hypothetical protein